MMIRNSREKEFLTRKNLADNGKKLKGPSTSRTWPSFKDRRIVRVARSSGGKDRHSKVFTVRGLRDRRVRLSVQTAIQLYDLQDKLGLSQPSKVIDWLLDAAQDDIDKLPPLQMPIETLLQYSKLPLAIPDEVSQNQYPSNSTMNYMKLSSEAIDPQIMNAQNDIREGGMKLHMCASCKQVEKETSQEVMVTHNSIARANQSLFANNITPYASYYHWEPSPSSSFTVPQYFGGNGCSLISSEDQYVTNPAALPHSLPVTSGSHLMLYPSGSSVSSTFPSFVPADCDLKNYLTNLQMPSQAPIVPSSLSTTTFYPPSSSMKSFQSKNVVSSKKRCLFQKPSF